MGRTGWAPARHGQIGTPRIAPPRLTRLFLRNRNRAHHRELRPATSFLYIMGAAFSGLIFFLGRYPSQLTSASAGASRHKPSQLCPCAPPLASGDRSSASSSPPPPFSILCSPRASTRLVDLPSSSCSRSLTSASSVAARHLNVASRGDSRLVCPDKRSESLRFYSVPLPT